MYLFVSVDYKKKRKIYYWFSAVLFSKKKVVMSRENLDNSTYGLPGKVRALQGDRKQCGVGKSRRSTWRQGATGQWWWLCHSSIVWRKQRSNGNEAKWENKTRGTWNDNKREREREEGWENIHPSSLNNNNNINILLLLLIVSWDFIIIFS